MLRCEGRPAWWRQARTRAGSGGGGGGGAPLRIESTRGGETSSSGGEEVVGGGERGGGGGDAAGEEVRENAPLSYSESEGTEEDGDKSLCSPLEGGEEGEEEMWGRESGDLDWEEVPGRDDREEVPGRDGPGEIGVELPARKEDDSIDEEESGERDRLLKCNLQ